MSETVVPNESIVRSFNDRGLAVPLLTRLASAAGAYRGSGVNHAGENFHAELTLAGELGASLITIQFRAVDATPDANGPQAAFHEERTWITEDLIRGGIGLWTVSSNTPGLLHLRLVEDTADGSYATRAVFMLGERDDLSKFREEISLNLRHDGAVEYVYSWGVPHEKFGVKSKALLKPVS